ncbi:unnamed protein product [Jaminaea pallidilutea]
MSGETHSNKVTSNNSRKKAQKKGNAAASAPTPNSGDTAAKGRGKDDAQKQQQPQKQQQQQQQRSKKPKGGKKSSSSASSHAQDSKQKLKVVVRRLPPNLPEEIFWKSVEPWTGKQVLQEPQKAKPVAKGSSRANGTEEKPEEAKPSGQTQPEAPGEETANGAADQGQADAESQSKAFGNDPATAQVASPPQRTAGSSDVLNLGAAGQDKLLWRRFVAGKFKTLPYGFASSSTRDPSMPPTHSRAYLRFKNMPDLLEFHRNFDGHIFRDSKGNESVALVEWAPYQKVPAVTPGGGAPRGKKRDKKEGTIHEDPAYLAFLDTLKSGGRGSEEAADKAGSGAGKSDAELAAALSSLSMNNQAATAAAKLQAAKTTPLLEHLRSKGLKKLARKGGTSKGSSTASSGKTIKVGKGGAASSSSISKTEAKALKAAKGHAKGAQGAAGQKKPGEVIASSAKSSKGKSKAKDKAAAASPANRDDAATPAAMTTTTATSSPSVPGLIPTGPKSAATTNRTKSAGGGGGGKGSKGKSAAAVPVPAATDSVGAVSDPATSAQGSQGQAKTKKQQQQQQRQAKGGAEKQAPGTAVGDPEGDAKGETAAKGADRGRGQGRRGRGGASAGSVRGGGGARGRSHGATGGGDAAATGAGA